MIYAVAGGAAVGFVFTVVISEAEAEPSRVFSGMVFFACLGVLAHGLITWLAS